MTQLEEESAETAFDACERDASASCEIVGILKTMSDEMSKWLADITAVERAAVTSYGELMTTKQRKSKR